MSKRQIRILAILAAVALLLGILLAVLRYEKKPEVLAPLVTMEAGEIDQLVFTGNHSINLHLQEGTWQVLLDDITLPAKEDTVTTILEQLCAVRPQQVLENPDPELFAASVLQATIELLSGTGSEQIKESQQIRIYSMNAITDQLYVQVGNTYYLTDTTLMKIFPGSNLELLQQYEIPKPDDHKSVTVENVFGTITLSCENAVTGGEEGVWYLQTADGWAEVDQDQAYNFYFLTWDMHFKSTAAVITEKSQLSNYGLDHPQAVYTLTYGNETFRLYLGKNLPDNTTYAMCDGSDLVYTMDTLLAQWLAQATADTLFTS